jgi:uncharacterized protein YecE (DUF72 family)
MLAWYAQRFDTVELNNSFYRLPSEGAFLDWRRSTPAGFRFAVKASRFITHMKKLKDPEEALVRFLARAELLKGKLGPILFQLPPWWECNLDRLQAFLAALPRGHRYTFELRNTTWHVPEVYRALRSYNAAFCIYEIAGFRSGMNLTADFTYVRLHGPGGAYEGSYDDAVLSEWVRRIRAWSRELKQIYVYFDNDQEAFAARNALRLRELL